jgi:hypothetical protein
MMVHMRHMGKSGKFAVVAGIVAALLLVLTGMTLAEPVFVAFLGVLALAYLSAIGEVLVRGRRLVLLCAGAGTSLAVGFALAFLSTWELAFDGQSSFLGTPLPTDDPDNYFVGAAVSCVATFLVLFIGAAWPAGRRVAPARRPAAKRRPAASRPAANGAAPKGAGPKAAAAKSAAAKSGAARSGAVQRVSGSGTTSRVPAAAKRPSSPAAPARRPAPKPGAGSTPRR